MSSKLQIRLGDLAVDVEGDPDLIREVYRDLKDQIAGRISQAPRAAPRADPPPAANNAEAPEAAEVQPNGAARRKAPKKKRSSGGSTEGRGEAYSPAVDKSVDTKGVAEFYAQFAPKSHSEKVLIFAEFLKGKGVSPCTADQIFTCYVAAKVQRPKAFRQAIVDAHGQKHAYIDYKSITDITVTHIGEDHLNFTMTRVAA